MAKEQSKFKGLATLLVLGVFAFIFIRFWNEPKKEKQESAGDYVAGEYFKATIETGRVDRDSIISLATAERLRHYDKEGGIIKFVENGRQWAYVEYHYPAAPGKVNAKDKMNNGIEVKILE
jgi:hypothetical protein